MDNQRPGTRGWKIVIRKFEAETGIRIGDLIKKTSK